MNVRIQRGRRKGTLGRPRPADVEVLWLIDEPPESDAFDETLRGSISFMDSLLARDADRTTHIKRLRRWACRYSTRDKLLAALLAARSSRELSRPKLFSVFLTVKPAKELDAGDRHARFVRCDALAPSALCNGMPP